MGVDVKLYVPPDVESGHVADFFAIKLGAKPKWNPEGWVDVEGNPRAEGVSVVSAMDHIYLGPAADKYVEHPVRPSFHYASRFKGKNYNQLMMKSTPVRVALAVEAARFFGGVVVARDFDPDDFLRFKRTAPVDKYGLIPDDGAPWERYQKALSKLKPLTNEEVVEAAHFAAYDDKWQVGVRGHMKAGTKHIKGSGIGKGWHKEPVRHSVAAKKGHAKQKVDAKTHLRMRGGVGGR